MTGGKQAKRPKTRGPPSSAPIEPTENVARRPTRGTTRHPPAPPKPKKGEMVSAAPLKRAAAGKASGTPADASSTPPPKRSGGRKEVEETRREEETPTTPNTRARAAAAGNQQEVVRSTEAQRDIRRKQTVGSKYVQQGQRKRLIPSPAASVPKQKRPFASKHDHDDDDDDADYVGYLDDDRSIDSDDSDDNNNEFGDDDGDKKMPAKTKRRGTADNIQTMDDGAASAKKKARISLNENEHVSHGHQLKRAGRQFVLDAIIKEEVYPRAKFPDTAALAFSNDKESICQFMAEKLKIADDNVEVWWRSTQKHVHRSLTKLRNNSIKGIKNRFEGKNKAM